MAIELERRQQVVSTNRRHEKDTGSPEVQIALITQRIRHLTDHLKSHEMDNHSRRGLIMMVGRRNRLLRYLARTDSQAYQALIARLGLRK